MVNSFCSFELTINLAKRMNVKTTNRIKVQVDCKYEHAQSSPASNEYLFSYKVTITNHSDRRVQLIKRKWYITDYPAIRKIVEGNGVIGQQPVLEIGDSHSYVSYCVFKNGIGNMKGYYTFYEFTKYSHFEVEIPEFDMCLPWLKN